MKEIDTYQQNPIAIRKFVELKNVAHTLNNN